MNNNAKNALNLCALLAKHVSHREFITDDESIKFKLIGWQACENLWSVGSLLSTTQRNQGKGEIINLPLLFETIGADGLKKSMKNVKITVNPLELAVNVGKTYTCISYPNLVKAFTFFEVVEGSYTDKAKTIQADQANQCFSNVPNPYLQSMKRFDLSDEETNIFLHCAYAFLSALVLAASRQDEAKKNTCNITEHRRTIQGRVYSNHKAATDIHKLSYEQVNTQLYEEHCKHFTEVNSLYGGYDSDDWYYFRFYEGAANTFQREDRYALSPSLGIKRYMNQGEYYTTK